ncbi:MAG: hypothetical protein WBF38_06770 [Nitrosotalea sp.]
MSPYFRKITWTLTILYSFVGFAKKAAMTNAWKRFRQMPSQKDHMTVPLIQSS